MGCFFMFKTWECLCFMFPKTGWWGNTKWFSIRSSGSLKRTIRLDYFFRRWQLTYFFMFTPNLGGEDSHFDEHICSKGLVQPPTSFFVGGDGIFVGCFPVFAGFWWLFGFYCFFFQYGTW